ncbi:MAG TPA: hypothetical protein VKT30_06625 [Caulobacteraceae bacterium]|nr:hypothetical protein [Caulobacteraceae bacterium]
MSAIETTIGGAERRTAPRTPTALRAKAFPGAVDCIVRDVSRRGARLQFLQEPPPGGRMIAVIWSTGAAIELQQRWRRGGEAGFEVLGRFDFRGPVPQRFAEVKAQWIARRPKLKRRQLNDGSVAIGYRGSLRALPVS